MTDLSDMIARRDEISRQIEAAQQQQAEDFNDELAKLEETLLAYLATTGLPFYQRQRKNVAIISADERVITGFGYQRGEYSGSLTVEYPPGGRAEFRNALPPAAAFIGLVRGLLGPADQAEAKATEARS